MAKWIRQYHKIEACLLGGAIGDAWGSAYENVVPEKSNTFYWNSPAVPEPEKWALTDDTQLTLATCDALIRYENLPPELLSTYLLGEFRKGKFTGLGAGTLKTFRDLEAGAHWSQAGHSGEYAAGNGAAMRIAPLALLENITREQVREYCRVTHRNDEAYAGAWAIVCAIRAALDNRWRGEENLLEIIISQLPDTRVRDRMSEILDLGDVPISRAAELGTSGYVVHSVPFAIYAASQIKSLGWQGMFEAIISAGGDTDTNASLAGQMAGIFVGSVPEELHQKLRALPEYGWIQEVLRGIRGEF